MYNIIVRHDLLLKAVETIETVKIGTFLYVVQKLRVCYENNIPKTLNLSFKGPSQRQSFLSSYQYFIALLNLPVTVGKKGLGCSFYNVVGSIDV